LKVNSVYQHQRKTERRVKNNKLDRDFEMVEEPKKKRKQRK
jgi:hypothetical protein